jgi:hypothetical protein
MSRNTVLETIDFQASCRSGPLFLRTLFWKLPGVLGLRSHRWDETPFLLGVSENNTDRTQRGFPQIQSRSHDCRVVGKLWVASQRRLLMPAEIAHRQTTILEASTNSQGNLTSHLGDDLNRVRMMLEYLFVACSCKMGKTRAESWQGRQ